MFAPGNILFLCFPYWCADFSSSCVSRMCSLRVCFSLCFSLCGVSVFVSTTNMFVSIFPMFVRVFCCVWCYYTCDYLSFISLWVYLCLRVLVVGFSRMKGSSRPFGGVQLVLCGDFFQLPPVGIGHGSTRFCFEAKTWDTSIDQSIVLKQVRSVCVCACMFVCLLVWVCLNEMKRGVCMFFAYISYWYLYSCEFARVLVRACLRECVCVGDYFGVLAHILGPIPSPPHLPPLPLSRRFSGKRTPSSSRFFTR